MIKGLRGVLFPGEFLHLFPPQHPLHCGQRPARGRAGAGVRGRGCCEHRPRGGVSGGARRCGARHRRYGLEHCSGAAVAETQTLFFFFLIYLLIMLLQLSHFRPFTPLHPAHPLPPTFPPYSSCPWVILISSLASTFPTLFLPSPCLFSTYHLCYLFSVPFPALSPSHSPVDNPPCDLHFCGSVPVLVVCLVCFCFGFRCGC